jgi:putative PIN family toxin of toxin-antitoxin system
LNPSLGVVLDVNIWLAAVLGADSEYPYLAKVPPQTPNASADVVSLALDGELFKVFISPHVINHVAKVLTDQGLSVSATASVLESITDIVHFSSGSVVEPQRNALESRDFEDNYILDLAISTGSSVIVTLDREFLAMSPWRNRLILHPRDFVANLLSRR